jgi:hypothetical protein
MMMQHSTIICLYPSTHPRWLIYLYPSHHARNKLVRTTGADRTFLVQAKPCSTLHFFVALEFGRKEAAHNQHIRKSNNIIISAASLARYA